MLTWRRQSPDPSIEREACLQSPQRFPAAAAMIDWAARCSFW